MYSQLGWFIVFKVCLFQIGIRQARLDTGMEERAGTGRLQDIPTL